MELKNGMPKECTDYLNGLFGVVYQRLQQEEQIILATAYLEKRCQIQDFNLFWGYSLLK